MDHPYDLEIQSDAEAEVREAREEAHCTTCRDPEEAAAMGHSECYDRILRDMEKSYLDFNADQEQFDADWDAFASQYDDDPNPYHGTYSEE